MICYNRGLGDGGGHIEFDKQTAQNLYNKFSEGIYNKIEEEMEAEYDAMRYLDNFELDMTLNRGISDVTDIESRNASKRLTGEIAYLCQQMESE